MRRILTAFGVALTLLASQLAIPLVLHAAITASVKTKIAYTSNATTIDSPTIDTTVCGAPCAKVIAVCGDTNGGTAPTDTFGNTYVGTTESGSTEFGRFWICLNCTTNASYKYALNSSTGAYLSSVFQAFSGVKTATALDVDTTPTTGTAATTLDSNTLTPGEAGTVMLAMSCDTFSARTHTGDITAGGGIFTEADEYAAFSTGFNMGLSMYYEIQSGTTARTFRVTFSASQNSMAVNLINLKMQPAAGARPPMLGSGVFQ